MTDLNGTSNQHFFGRTAHGPSGPSPALHNSSSSSSSAAPAAQLTADSTSSSRGPREEKKPACAGCRGIKVRCIYHTGGPCARCQRLGIECSFPPPQTRGRRPKPRTSESEGSLQQSSLLPPTSSLPPLPSTSRSYPESSPAPPWSVSLPPISHAGVVFSGSPPMQGQNGSMSLPLPPTSIPAPTSPGSGHAHAGSPSTTLSTSSAPNAVDNSLQALVEETERKSASANERMAAPPPHVTPNPTYPDAVDLHIIGMLEAEQLFDLFHEHLNPFIKLFDRRLHTAQWVRQSSSVLFTSLLAVSAKFHRPAVYPTLLVTAQQLVTRGIADGLPASHIGLVQSICVLVYWKEPSDGSSWIKVGFAIRLGYQLRLHTRRQHPLPMDETEARMVLDRERTWLNLVCFDSSYSDSDGGSLMASPYGLKLDKWLSESLMYDCPDDVLLCASVECGKVHTLCGSIESCSSPMAAQALVTHCDALVAEAYGKYFEPAFVGGVLRPAAQKMRFVYIWASVSISKAHMVATNFEETMVIAEFLRRAGELVVVAVENAESGLMLKLQDSMSVMLFKLAEALAKAFVCVKVPDQATIINYLTTIYRACNSAKKGDEQTCCAYVARFYRSVIRALSLNVSGPPSRAPSPNYLRQRDGGGGDVKPDTAAPPPPSAPPAHPFATNDMHDIFSGFSPDSFDPLGDGIDAAYWESVFPGQTADDYNWLTLRMTGSPAPTGGGAEVNGNVVGSGQIPLHLQQQQQHQRMGLPSPLSGLSTSGAPGRGVMDSNSVRQYQNMNHHQYMQT